MRPNLRERFFKGGFHLSRGRFFGYTSRHIRKMPVEILCVPAPLLIEHAGNYPRKVIFCRHTGRSCLGLEDGGVPLR
jgi:hypothetical protein